MKSGATARAHPPSLQLTALLIAALMLAGCAIGNRYDYAGARSPLAYAGSGRVSAGVQDRREDVVEDPSEATKVGTQRMRNGIPFSVTTASGAPLAEDFAASLQGTLAAAGFETTRVALAPGETAAAVRTRLLATAPRRAVLLRIDDWHSDTLKNPTVRYDLTLSILDARGTPLASQRLHGEDDLHGSFFGAIREARQTIPKLFERKLGELLNAPEIRRALAA